MFKICSRDEIVEIITTFPGHLMIISINDVGQDPPFDVNDPAIGESLVLHFDDVLEDNEYKNARAMSILDAATIINFITRHIYDATSKEDCIYVHCGGGVSRSAAVVAALEEIFEDGGSWKIFENVKYAPNRHVFETMLKAAHFKLCPWQIDKMFEYNEELLKESLRAG